MKFPVLKKLVINGETVVEHFVAETREEVAHLIASGHLGEADDGKKGGKAKPSPTATEETDKAG